MLVGPNGSGKTTLLRSALGLAPLAAGSVRTCGQPVRLGATANLARQAALVVQEPDHQLCRASVVDEVAWGAPDRAAVAAELAWFGLDPLVDRHPLSLSPGERRRVTMAAALARRPALLLLDEPSVGQDDRHQARMLERLHAYCRTGGCLLTATHDRRAAAALAGMVLCLDGGRIARGGPDLLAEGIL